jgi:uncharacterized protein (DUF362 family)/NAD-dependent dihydropyrimidine dehydrogenase PreA subunit
MSKTDVFVYQIQSYNDFQLKDKIFSGLEKSGGRIAAGKRVLIKPNILGAAKPYEAVTTHPAVLDAVISYFKKLDCEIRVGDSPAIDSYQRACKATGIAEVCEKNGVELVDFNETVVFQSGEGSVIKRFNLTKHIEWAEIIVSVPKMKTHMQMYYTGALKNMFGTISGLTKSSYHVRFIQRSMFAQMIVDVNVIVKPHFAVMDGIEAMQGNGPRNGTVYRAEIIAVSSDSLALDCVCSGAMGFNPMKVPILSAALKRENFYIDSLEEIKIAGDFFHQFTLPGFERPGYVKDIAFMRDLLPGFLYNFIRGILMKRPVFNREKCVLCKKCVDICQADALSVVDKHVIINHNKCIQCYCCHESCPYDAIDLK